MDTGWKVSLGGHGALLLAALVGWPFASDTESAAPQTVNVTLVTMDEMPVAGAPTPPRAEAPDPAQAPVEIDDIAALAPELAPEEAPRPPEPPARPARPDPVPEAKAPTPPKPATPAAPPPPVDRVAPVPQPAPPKDLPEADQQQEAVKKSPEPAPQAVQTEEQDAAAPKEAAPQIVTEAVETSPRPDRRPARPEPVAVAEPEPEPEPEPEVAETPETREPEPEPEPVKEPPKPKTPPKTEPKAAPKKQPDVNSALAEAMAADPGPAQAEPQSSGPPLTQGERDGLRVAVSRCWNIAALSTESAQVTVIVGMEMSLDGVPSNLRMVSYSGGTEAAAQQAYETARRAVLRCQPYSLPAEKYDQWRTIEMTFNPDDMRRR